MGNGANLAITAISLVASLLTIIQFFVGKDRSARIVELEQKNEQLTARLLDSPSANEKEATVGLSKDAQFSELRHQFLLYDHLFRDCAIGSVVFFCIAFAVVGHFMTPPDEGSNVEVLMLGVPVGFLFAAILHLVLRARLFSTSRALVQEMALTQAELISLLTWVGAHPWRKESARDTLTAKLNQWA